LRELKELARTQRRSGLWGVLVSVPGIVDEPAGKVLYSPNLHWLEGADLPGLIRSVWDLPVELLQEIRALALGHAVTNEPGEEFLLADFGHGVGGAIVTNGKLHATRMPLAGEIGHTPVAGNTRKCGCGAAGCLETLVSEEGLLESFARNGGVEQPTWKDLMGALAPTPLPKWLRLTLDDTARILAGALNVLGIQHLVITGRLAELPPEAIAHLSAGVERGALWGRFGKITVSAAPHRRAAGLVARGLDQLVLPARKTSADLTPAPSAL
jgi:glucokinase